LVDSLLIVKNAEKFSECNAKKLPKNFLPLSRNRKKGRVHSVMNVKDHVYSKLKLV